MRKLVTGLLLLLSVPLAAESTIPKPDARVLNGGGPALRYTIHEPATAATNRPMVVLIQPDINPRHGWKMRERKRYSPPELGSAAPNSL